MKFIVLLVLKLMFYHDVNSVGDAELGKVVFVNLLWRHGERNPFRSYEGDPYMNESYWPEGLAQLTNVGKKQHYELGQWLRQRYDSLLTDEYSPYRVHVRSTDIDRTLMSAQANLAGMYPPRGCQVWDNQLPWQPIPVHTIPFDKDKVLAAHVPCPAYDEELKRVLKSEEIHQVYNKYRNIRDVLFENSGGDVYDFQYTHDVWDALISEKRRGYSLPKWAEDILPQMPELVRYRFLVESWNKKLGRLKSGLLIKEMVDNMQSAAARGSRRAVSAYSGHDMTIVNLLRTLGAHDGLIPPYAACVMLELREGVQGGHAVTLFYRNSTSGDPYLLTVPGCDAACPLAQFIQLAQPVIPEDWDRECQKS